MFNVTYTFFPILCAYFIVFSKSSSCISALVLSDNDDVPAYTASAPYKNAIFAFSKDPAGANNSGLFNFVIASPSPTSKISVSKFGFSVVSFIYSLKFLTAVRCLCLL